jgi:hypothetical protein
MPAAPGCPEQTRALSTCSPAGRSYIEPVMSDKSLCSCEEFTARIREIGLQAADIREADCEGQPGRQAFQLVDNRFYHFDGESARGFVQAVEELAIEEASGTLLTAFGEFTDFEAGRERYEQLAMALDHVEVIGSGKTPRPIRRLRFIHDSSGRCRDFLAAVYTGRRGSAWFAARRIGTPRKPISQSYRGFYSFNARRAGRLRQELLETASGRAAGLPEFARLLAIDQFAKELAAEFNRQKDEMLAAVRRLQAGDEAYRPGKFASDLEQGLTRLQQWKNRLPSVLEQVQCGKSA